MSDSRLFLDHQFLRTLSPLDKASPHQLSEITNQIVITQLRPNQPLFQQGDYDNQTVYLLKGTVELFQDGKVVDTISSGTNAARRPLAHKQPREMSALAKSEATIARIDSALLDFLLTSDHSAQYEITEIDVETVHDAGWLTRILQSKAFLRLPMDNIQKMIMRMQPVEVRAGDTVVREGDEGDYYYVIKQGSCRVTRKGANGSEVTLAELHDGDGFGEEALLSGTRRNATLTMITDGTLMRLPKQDFLDLLIVPLLNHLKYEEAAAQVRKGAVWLDVRPQEEYRQSHIKDSFNLPLSELRESAAKLDAGRTYIVCCNTGRHSVAAAFLLSERGFDAGVLVGGLKSVPADALVQTVQPVAAQAAAVGASSGGAEIINFKGPATKPTAIEAKQAHPSPQKDAEIERLKAELEQVRSRSEAQIAQIKSQTRTYVDEIKREAATAVEHAEKARQNAERKAKELESALVQAQRTARAPNEGTAAQGANEFDASRSQLEQAQAKAQKLHTEVATLKARIEELEVAAVETDLAREELMRLKDEAAMLKGELQKARARAATAGEQKRQAEEEAAHLKLELESLASRTGQAGRDGKAEQARAALEQEVRRLRAQLAEAQQNRGEASSLKDEIAARDAELHDLRAQYTTLAQEKVRLEAALSAGDTKLTQVTAEHQASRAALEAELAALRSRLAAMAEKTETTAAAVQQQAEERVQQLTAEIERLRRHSTEVERARAEAEQARTESARRLAQLEAGAAEERARLRQALAAAEELARQENQRRKESEAELQALKAQDRGASRGGGIDAGEVARFNDEIARLVQENQYLETMRRESEETIAALRESLAEFKQLAEEEARNRKRAEEEAAALHTQTPSSAQLRQDPWDSLLGYPTQQHALPDAVTPAGKFEVYGEWLGWHMRRVLATVGGLLLLAAVGAGLWFASSEGWFAQYLPWAAISAVTDDDTESAPDKLAESTPDRKAEPAQRNQPPPAAEQQAADKPKPQRAAPVRTLRDTLAGGGSGPLMVALPAGTFDMGSGSGSPYFDERPQHTVSVKRFAISKHEITFAEYDAFAAATGRSRPNDQGWGRGARPVINVTWQDAAAYAEWLSQQTGHRYRLPSEAEWEYAARAGSGTLYWWGLEPSAGKAVCFDCGSSWDGKQTAPVGSLKANAFGLHDVSGNVEEWVQDCYHSNYDGAPNDAGVWKGGDCSKRIARGGSYRNTKTEMRTSRRSHYSPNTRLDTIGFRVAREY